MVAVTAGMVAVMGILPAAAQVTPSASRSFDSASVDPGGRVMVTIAASDYGAAGGVTETLPAGFSYVNSSLDAVQVSELANNQVRFTLQGDSSFTYNVTASGRTGTYAFSGTLRDFDRTDHPVGGATRVTVNTPPAGPTPSASRSFDSASVDPGGRVMVTIAASDYGAAGGVTETLPAGFSYVNSSLDAVQVSELGNNQVRFTLQGDSLFTYTVTASGRTGSYTFSGTLRDAARTDRPVGGADSVTVNTPPEQAAPSASRSFDSASVDPGGGVVVTIAASDYGAAGGVTETLPAGFSYVNSSLDAVQVSELANNQVRFTLQGDSLFTYTVTASDTPGPYTFSGTLRDADRTDRPVGGANSVTVKGPEATRSFSSSSVRPGARVTVTIRASNYGEAGGVTETLPAGFSYVNSSLDDFQVSELANNQVRFTLQGDSLFTYTVTASDTPGPYTFSGTLRDADRTDRPVGGANSVTVKGPEATRSFSSSSVRPGARVTVTIRASNYGEAGGVTETLPAGFSYVNSSLDDFQVSELANNQVRFTLQGDSLFTYTVTASDTPGPYTFSGTLRDADRTDRPVGGANSVTVKGPEATRSFSSSSVRPGARVTVTIRASNYGEAGGVTETLPAGFSYVNNSLDDFQVSELANNQVRFTLQGDSSFTYTVTASGRTGSYTFSGTLRDADRNDHTVVGATRITVRSSSGGGGGGTTPPANRAPVFSEGSSASRSVAENSAAGTVVGSPVTATDRDGDRLTYRLSGTDESLFSVDASTGQVSVAQGTALDFEVKNSFAVSVRASDPSRSADNISITIRVSNVDEDGQVTLSPQQPKIGTELSAALTDPDGSVSNTSWTWERSTDNTAWAAIAGARSNTYTPVEADEDQYLRAAVAYTDGHGSNKRAATGGADRVTATPEPTATATPEPTATATPEPTATATPEPTATYTGAHGHGYTGGCSARGA